MKRDFAPGWGTHWVNGVDYRSTVLTVGPRQFLFPADVLGGYGDAVLEIPAGLFLLRLVATDPGGILCLADTEGDLPQKPVLTAPVSGDRTVAYWDAYAPQESPLAMLPAAAEGAACWAVNDEGLPLALWKAGTQGWKEFRLSEWMSTYGPQSHPAGTGKHLPGRKYEPEGVLYTVESMIREMGVEPAFHRRGRYSWRIPRGTATLHLDYTTPESALSAEIHMAALGTQTDRKGLFRYLLRANMKTHGYGFGLLNDVVVMSLVIPARFLDSARTAGMLSEWLEQADRLDQILINDFGAERISG